jgi:hypothetical protein
MTLQRNMNEERDRRIEHIMSTYRPQVGFRKVVIKVVELTTAAIDKAKQCRARRSRPESD